MDKESWVDLALWLQNRADETGAPSGYDWFPAMPADLSFAVFAIDFRGHGESAEAAGFDPAGFLQDAQAALATGKTLAGVDPARIITIGASIGADASVDACVTLDGSNVAADQANQGCIGAMPLSPGNFLGVSYTEAAARLGDDPHDAYVYCIAAENDANAPDLCRAELGSHHRPTIYAGGAHGINLLQPGLSPDIGQLILDFLLESLGLE
jgi:pimeloyl-ACP methyl ester carboxylesterase